MLISINRVQNNNNYNSPMPQSPHGIKNTKRQQLSAYLGRWQEKIFSLLRHRFYAQKSKGEALLGISTHGDLLVASLCIQRAPNQFELCYCEHLDSSLKEEFSSLHTLPPQKIALALDDELCFSKTLTFETHPNQSQIKNALIDYLTNLKLHLNEEINFDYQIYKKNKKQYLLICAATTEKINTYLNSFKINIEAVHSLEPKSHAVERFFHINYPEFSDEVFLFIHIQSHHVSSYLFSDSNIISNHTPPPNNEKISDEHQLDSIKEKIRHILHENKNINRVLLSSNESTQKAIQHFILNNFELDVLIVNPFKQIPISPNLNIMKIKKRAHLLIHSLGLSLKTS
ncbi:MAG: hypothetical protein HY939_05175 [Gammaproteobacteria bacterium]|nr:hypothetical protein [Gammaproteobacteria bacterium]